MSQLQGSSVLYIQPVPIFLFLASIVLVLRVLNIVNVKQLFKQHLSIRAPSWFVNTIQPYLYLLWSLPLYFFCVYEILIKYQYLFKQYINNIQHTLYDSQIHFTSHQKNDRDQTPETQDCDTTVSSVTTHHIQKPQCKFKDVPVRVNVIPEEKVAINIEQEQQLPSKQEPSLDRKKSSEWTVVKEHKKKKKSRCSPVSPKTIPKEKKRSSTPVCSSIKNTKSHSKRQYTKNATSSPISNNCKNNNNTSISCHLPWSDIVKNQESESDHDDVPVLSDNDSITGSIESPCMSYKSLVHHPMAAVGTEPTENENQYYSPFFSTAFDFGVLPSSQPQRQEQVISREITSSSTIYNRLDEYLNSQRPYWNGNKQYTPTSMTQHQRSILNLLNQSDQVETTITPTSFAYFDDMMMSTSLYKTYKTDESVNKYTPLMNINKRDWDSITHYIH